MKKFLLFIFLLTYSFNASAHMAHYNKFNKIEMEILRDGEVIGYNYYFFKKDVDNTTITNQLKFTVKLFGATIFEVESYGEEKYIKDKLISFNSKTQQNKKDKYVKLKLNEEKNEYDIKGSSYTGSASIENVIGNWWSHKILQTNSQISPISGSIKEQVVTFIGKEKIELYGKTHDVEHFKLTSKDMSIPKNKRLKSNNDLWTLKSTNLWANKKINKNRENKKKNSKILIDRFFKLTGIKRSKILISLNHGWKYSSNSRSLKVKSYWNNKLNLGVCADWFVGPRVEAGWISANDLFKKINK